MKCNGSFLVNCIPHDGKTHQWPQIFAVIVATLGTVSTGALTTWTSPSIPILTSNSSHLEPITLEAASYFAIIPGLTAVLALPVMAILLSKFGRKIVIGLISFLYFCSWALIIAANNVYILYLSRVFEGIGDASGFTAIPIYVAEVTEPKVRVYWGSMIVWTWYLGQFLVNTLGAYCDIRTTALILISICVLQFVLLFFIPESPYYYIIKNREDKAKQALEYLLWKEDVEDELKTLKKDVHRQISESGTVKEVFVNSTHRKAFLISVGLRACQQFGGLPAFCLYTQYLFEQAGSSISASLSSIIFCGVLLTTVTFAMSVIDKFGRKPLMIYSSLGCGLVMLFEALYFVIHEMTAIDTSSVSWLPLAGMITYIPVCTIGVGTLPGVMAGELFSASIKEKAIVIFNMFYFIFVLTVAKAFQVLSSNFGMFVPFSFFAVTCFLAVAFCYFFVPETKDKTLEEIQQDLKGANKDKEINAVKINKA